MRIRHTPDDHPEQSNAVSKPVAKSNRVLELFIEFFEQEPIEFYERLRRKQLWQLLVHQLDHRNRRRWRDR